MPLCTRRPCTRHLAGCNAAPGWQPSRSAAPAHDAAAVPRHLCTSPDRSSPKASALQAAAALYMGRKGRGAVPFWPSVLRTLTGYREDVHPEVGAG